MRKVRDDFVEFDFVCSKWGRGGEKLGEKSWLRDKPKGVFKRMMGRIWGFVTQTGNIEEF